MLALSLNIIESGKGVAVVAPKEKSNVCAHLVSQCMGSPQMHLIVFFCSFFRFFEYFLQCEFDIVDARNRDNYGCML